MSAYGKLAANRCGQRDRTPLALPGGDDDAAELDDGVVSDEHCPLTSVVQDAADSVEIDCDACSTIAPSELDGDTIDSLDLSPEPPLDDTTVYDVVADADGHVVLLPACGEEAGGLDHAVPLSDLSEDAVVTVRVFRFFEDRADEKHMWELELRNVNSGSLLWLVVHMQPRMHSVGGCKYGEWFTVHHLRVRVSCLKAAYHMAQDGACPLAKSFGATAAVRGLVSGERLSTGYFWFVTPDGSRSGKTVRQVSTEESLETLGWQHVCRQGPYDGSTFMAMWQREGSPMCEARVQHLLNAFAAQ